MRRQAATDIDPLPLHEILIRPDRRELQRLIELRRDAGGFKVVEDEIHVNEPSVLRRYDPLDNGSTSSIALGGKPTFAARAGQQGSQTDKQILPEPNANGNFVFRIAASPVLL